MRLNPQIKRNPIFGLGCVAGAAGLSRAADYVRAYPDQVAILLAIELCSLTWQRDDFSVANMISTGLFGDGAAAVLVAGEQTHLKGPKILGTASSFYPDTEQVMGWKISEKGFQVMLSPDVPKVVKKNLGRDVDNFLAQHGMTRDQVHSWIMHPGGPKVLEAVSEALNLHDGELSMSWEALQRVGNLSSASVLVVLDQVMTQRRPHPGARSVLAAMGPGFGSEMLLLEW
jgi:alkylresorcinol/alkylpyrone synthase